MLIFIVLLLFQTSCCSLVGDVTLKTHSDCDSPENDALDYSESNKHEIKSDEYIERALSCKDENLSSISDGGWAAFDANADARDLIAKLTPYESLCDIEKRSVKDLTYSEFIHRYVPHRPVILLDADDNAHFRSLTSRGELLSSYGKYNIRLSTANTHSYNKVDTTLSHYISHILRPQSLNAKGNETFYWFGDNNYTEFEKLFQTYNPPKYSIPNMLPAYSFGVAGVGTGVPFHFHGPGFAEVLYGQKMWFLSPPDQEPQFHPDLPTLHWLLNDYSNIPSGSIRPMICTIRPGEVIFFPDRWWHATLNTRTSVFISTFLN